MSFVFATFLLVVIFDAAPAADDCWCYRARRGPFLLVVGGLLVLLLIVGLWGRDVVWLVLGIWVLGVPMWVIIGHGGLWFTMMWVVKFRMSGRTCRGWFTGFFLQVLDSILEFFGEGFDCS